MTWHASIYSTRESCVRHLGIGLMSFNNIEEFDRNAMPKFLHKHGEVARYERELRQTGYAEITWEFRRGEVVRVRSYRTELGFYRSQIFGTATDKVFERIARGIRNRTNDYVAYRLAKLAPKPESPRARKKRERQKLREQQPQPQRQSKRRRTAALSLADKERVVPQFRKHAIFWQEVIPAIEHIFRVRGNSRHTAAELIHRDLHRMLEKNGTFVQYRRGGFTLRFDLVQFADDVRNGRITPWRGDHTPLSISATKKNTHPTYRRMRKYFRETLGQLNEPERSKRQKRMAKKIEAIVLGGKPYACLVA